MSTEQKKSDFRFTGFQVLETNLTRSPGESEGKLQSNINLSGTLFKKDKQFALLMDAAFSEEGVFDAKVKMIGFFEFKADFSETADHFFYLNAPAILFPHLRAYISALTALSGMSAIVLPTFNLTNLAEKLKKSTSIQD